MKRTPLERKTPLSPKQPPHRTAHNSTLRPVNSERKARRASKGEVYGPYHDFVGTLSCSGSASPDHECEFYPFAGRPGVEGDHIVTVAAGGKDYGNEWPLCPFLHDVRHRHGVGRVESMIRVEALEAAEAVRRLWDSREKALAR